MLNWRQLVWLPEQELGVLDVAEVNLACAVGLPGTMKLDYAECVNRLNYIARYAGPYIEGRLPEFYKDPAAWDGSLSKFRVVQMLWFLRQVHNIRYNPAKVPADAPFFAEDTFIHGALLGAGGTCASLPVIYASVGRRLGFPLKLVECLRHQFIRWDEPDGERFNIDANARAADDPPDDYYRRGRYECTPALEKMCCFLVSMTPRMELASFLAERGYLLAETGGRWREAAEAVLWASALVPQNGAYADSARFLLATWRKKLEEMAPPSAPEIVVGFPQTGRRRFPQTLPPDVERHFLMSEAYERCLTEPRHQGWWEELRRARGRERPWNVPTTINVWVPPDLWSSGP